MPGETSPSTNLNTRADKQNTYDAIVIGSGISGGWAAKELTEKGLKVLMLERGGPYEHIKDYKTASLKPWEFEHRGRTTAQQRLDYPVIHRGWAASEAVMDAWTNEKDSPLHRNQALHLVAGLPNGRSQHPLGPPKLPAQRPGF